jgi:MATE family multidrug resistance protein
MLLAQLSSMGMMVIDTVLLGHYATDDLAAVAVGGGIYISVVFALTGILQAVAPTVAHLHGAGRHQEIAGALQQALWLALAARRTGRCFFSTTRSLLLALSPIDPGVESKARAYLALLALGMPAILALPYLPRLLQCARPAASAVTDQPRQHAAARSARLAAGHRPPGEAKRSACSAAGCRTSPSACFSLLCALLLICALAGRCGPITCSPAGSCRAASHSASCCASACRWGFSHFVEISSFTLMALLCRATRRDGPSPATASSPISPPSAICCRWRWASPRWRRSAEAAGARDWPRAERSIGAGLLLAGVLSALLGLLLWLIAAPLTAAYTDDREVQAVALGLLGYVAGYQTF